MKLFVFDIDGTLVDNTCILSKENIDAINEKLRQGHVIAIASGRPFNGIKHYLDEFIEGKKFAIGGNGAIVYDQEGNILFAKGIDHEEFLAFRKRHCEYVEKGYSVYCYTYKEVGYYEHTPQIDLERERNLFPERNLYEQPFQKGEMLQKFMINAPKEELDKFVLTEEDKKFHYMRTEPYYLEFVSKDVDKSAGVEFVRNLLGLEKDQVYCFGDQGNDVKMISNYVGIAMDNAIPECKKAAKFITKSVSENGVAFALKTLIK